MFTSHKQISPPSLVLKLKISEVSQKWIPKAVELKRIPTHKKCKCKKFCSQTRLVGEIYSSDVIMHRGYSSKPTGADQIWKMRYIYYCSDGIFDWKRCCMGNEPSINVLSSLAVYSRVNLKKMAFMAIARYFWLKLNERKARIRKIYCSMDVIYFLRSICNKNLCLISWSCAEK